MSIVDDMLRLACVVEKQHCRVTQWKINDTQVWALAEVLAPMNGCGLLAMVDRMCRGTEKCFGAKIKVTLPDTTRTRFA